MGDIEPGWYDDTEDPQLARWWDGRAWTQHTLVISDQVPGTEPPPPARPATRFPVPQPSQWLDDPSYEEDEREEAEPLAGAYDPGAYEPLHTAPTAAVAAGAPVTIGAPTAAPSHIWADEPEAPSQIGSFAWPPVLQPDHEAAWQRLDIDEDDDESFPWNERRRGLPREDRTRRITTFDGPIGDRIRDLPMWVRIALPVLSIVLLVAAVASATGLLSDDGGSGGGATLTDDSSVDAKALRDAADAALEAADVSWFTRQGFMASIPPMCAAIADGDADKVADRVILLGYDDFTAARLVIGLEAGAQSFCPEDLAEHPGFFEQVARLAGVDLAAGATTSTAPTVVTTVAPATTTATTKPTTATTARRSTPAPTPTAAPTTTVAPTTTTAPTTTAPTTTTASTTPTDGGTTGGATS